MQFTRFTRMRSRSVPSTPQELCEKAQHFGQRWNFHHAVGAPDSKHVAIRCPRQSGSKYYTYKGFY